MLVLDPELSVEATKAPSDPAAMSRAVEVLASACAASFEAEGEAASCTSPFEGASASAAFLTRLGGQRFCHSKKELNGTNLAERGECWQGSTFAREHSLEELVTLLASFVASASDLGKPEDTSLQLRGR
jgi:hypothetical protein